MYRKYFKRILDFFVAFFGCIVLLPVFVLVAIILLVANKGNPFFIQIRPGKNGSLFKIFKFKTMNDARDQDGDLLPDSERLTYVGQLIRKTSLDEIPQLFNVLKGDMSLIGPRPLLPEYLHQYTAFERQRHEVRPGITGLAAVKGRNALNWTEKFKYDVWYVKNLSFFLDMKIIFMTFLKVIKSEGITSENSATTEPYNGRK